ncbi:MAG: hypothetical protein QM278_08135 [Pseudomonadota bacterium]|nr:hypothetical protein [Pseudomonadota bacterium]
MLQTQRRLIVIGLIFSILSAGWITQAAAFSVDVKHLYYYDPSGPREIDYDFSAAGAAPPQTPPNNIEIPMTNPPILRKHAADRAFRFGNIPEVGAATVTLEATEQVGRITTTGGGAILQGASSGPPPQAATSWTFSLKLQNFVGIADPTKSYRFEIGAAAPHNAGPQPRFRGVWNASGRLELSTAIHDDAGQGTTLWSGTNPVVFTGLTPTTTVLELKIINDGTNVTFSYNKDGAGWTNMPGVYAIAAGIVFNSLPMRFPYLYMEEEAPQSPFVVNSHHWDDSRGNAYYAWARVEDPGQTLYSGVSMHSQGYLAETPLTYNSAGGYWSLPGTLFDDDFNDNSLDPAKWTPGGGPALQVTESDGMLKVARTTDAAGYARSRFVIINPYAPIVLQSKITAGHGGKDFFRGAFGLRFWETPDVAGGTIVKSAYVSHMYYKDRGDSDFYLDSGMASYMNAPPSVKTTAIWDVPFLERIVYNPTTGVAELWIDGIQKATANIGPLPPTAKYMDVMMESFSWGVAGPYYYFDDLSVSQPWVGGAVFLSANSPPTGDVVFNFTATKKGGGTETATRAITGYVTEFATNLQPKGNVSIATPTFSWTGIAGATHYGIEVSDADGNRIWNRYNIPPTTTSTPYAGPALVSGQTYHYHIVSTIVVNGIGNTSFAGGDFTYLGTPGETIAFNGWAKTAPNWPSTDGMTALQGTTVSAYQPGTPPILIETVPTDGATGAFSLTGIPKSTTFYLLTQPPGSAYAPVLSKYFNWDKNIQALLPFSLFTAGPTGQYPSAFGNTPGTGLIVGRVARKDSPTTFLAGATIEAREWTPGDPPVLGATYPVAYTSGSATGTDGIYMVKNIPNGKQVRLTATLAGHTFESNGAIVPTQAGFISEESFFGVASTAPTIAGLSATSGAYGSDLTITGVNFGDVPGRVLIGGSDTGIAIKNWTNTSITVTAARSGNVVVVAGGVSSSPSAQSFQVTSPYFTIDVMNPTIKVIKGQKAEFILKAGFYNGFTTAGITLSLQGGDAAALSGKDAFIPAPLLSPGGVVLAIDTKSLSAGVYTADIQALHGGVPFPAGTFTLQVVTVKDIQFYEFNNDTKTYLISKNVTAQGQLVGLLTEVTGSDNEIFSGDADIALSATSPILGVYKRFWGYDIYAQDNGTVGLRATAPDGTERELPITVNFPKTSWVSYIGFDVSPVHNNRTAPIIWSAVGTTELRWIGCETSGMMNFQTDFLDKLVRSSDGKSATSTFNLQNPPVDIGTAIFYAATEDGKAKAVVPLKTINAPGTSLLAFQIKNVDQTPIQGMITLHFFGEDNQLKFSRDIFPMHAGVGPVLVGNIPPGTYKLLFAPKSTNVIPRWWPNAIDVSRAAPLTFGADDTVGNVYFFALSQPAGGTVTLETSSKHFGSAVAATGTINVTATPGTVWVAMSNVPWISCATTGAGNGVVTYNVLANPGSGSRTGTITIGDQTFTVGQAGTLLKGDINDDGKIDLVDAILALQALAGKTPVIRSDYVASGTDVNGDNKVGLAEVLYILQGVAGLQR